MTQDLFGRFHELVSGRCDLSFPGVKTVYFESRLRERLSQCGHADYESYYNYLADQPEEMQRLLQGLTVNETRFFRNEAQFNALRDEVFPDMIEKKNMEVVKSWGKDPSWTWGRRHPSMNFRIWSAGCSTGDEAYSIAFTALESLKFPRAWDIEVMATDINRAVLDTARRGIYDKGSVKTIKPGMLARYMDSMDGGFIVKEHPASLVKFYEANLKDISTGPGVIRLKPADGPAIDLDASGYFDVIFCRNVMIYFDRAAQQRLVNSLYDCLRPGGFLFTGDSEPLHLFDHGFETVVRRDAVYYVKPS